MVDVVSRRCEEADCRRRPLYGHEGEKGRFCSYHKASDIVLHHPRVCTHVPLLPPSLLVSPHINIFTFRQRDIDILVQQGIRLNIICL